MAEFCLNCFNEKLNHTGKKLTEDDVVLQWDFCEGCGKNLPCVMQIIDKEHDDE